MFNSYNIRKMQVSTELTKAEFDMDNVSLYLDDDNSEVTMTAKKDDKVLHISIQDGYESTLLTSQMTHEEARFLAKSLLAMVGEGDNL